MRGAQFSATLNSKKYFGLYCRDQTSMGTLVWKRGPEVWDSLLPHCLI